MAIHIGQSEGFLQYVAQFLRLVRGIHAYAFK